MISPALPFFVKLGSFKNPIPKRELGNEQKYAWSARLALPAHAIARQALHSK